MNDVLNALLSRRSVRKFKPDPVPQDKLDAILEAARFAPSGGGRPGNRLVVVQNSTLRNQLSRMNAAVLGKDTDPYYGAPVIIFVFADKTKSTPVEDGSLALGNLFLAAHSLGLGSCWIHRAREMFESPEGRDLLRRWGVDDRFLGIGACSLGYPDGPLPAPAPRKPHAIIFAQP